MVWSCGRLGMGFNGNIEFDESPVACGVCIPVNFCTFALNVETSVFTTIVGATLDALLRFFPAFEPLPSGLADSIRTPSDFFNSEFPTSSEILEEDDDDIGLE